MKLEKLMTRRSLAKALSGGSLAAIISAMLIGGVQTADAQYRFIPEHRRPVDETIHNLQEVASHNPHGPREQRRYDIALRHLSEFAGRLQQGFWDDRRLGEAIGDVRFVADGFPIDQHGRDLLHRDIEELRHLRDRHDGRYHYPY